MAAGHLHRRQLPGRRVPVLERVFRRQGQAAGAGGGCGGGQPPSAAGGPGDQAGRVRRDPAGSGGLRPGRSASIAGARGAVFRRRARGAAVAGPVPRRLGRMQERHRFAGHGARPRARAGAGDARPAPGDGQAAAARADGAADGACAGAAGAGRAGTCPVGTAARAGTAVGRIAGIRGLFRSCGRTAAPPARLARRRSRNGRSGVSVGFSGRG